MNGIYTRSLQYINTKIPTLTNPLVKELLSGIFQIKPEDRIGFRSALQNKLFTVYSSTGVVTQGQHSHQSSDTSQITIFTDKLQHIENTYRTEYLHIPPNVFVRDLPSSQIYCYTLDLYIRCGDLSIRESDKINACFHVILNTSVGSTKYWIRDHFPVDPSILPQIVNFMGGRLISPNIFTLSWSRWSLRELLNIWLSGGDPKASVVKLAEEEPYPQQNRLCTLAVLL